LNGRPPVIPPGVLLVLAASVLWGTTGTTQALAPSSASPLAVGSLRLLVGAGALLLLSLARGRLRPALLRAAPGPMAVLAIGIAAYQLAFFSGVRLAGVAVGTLVGIGSAPIFAGFLSWAVDGRRPGLPWLLATTLGVVGCALLVLPAHGAGLPPVHPGGLALTLLAGAAYATLSLAGQRLGRHAPADAGTAVAFAGGALLLLPVLVGQDLAWLSMWPSMPLMLHLGIFATAVPYVLYLRALRTVPVPTAVTLTLAEPLTAATLGLAVLGERLTATGYAGLACLVGGLALLALADRRQRPPAPV